MRFELATATRIVFGAGALAELGSLCAELGRRALVVTGKDPARAERARKLLAEKQISSSLLCIGAEPTTEDARRGLELARGAGCDLVLGVGGGSALDAGKAIAALLANGGDPLDYLEVIGKGRKITRRSAPYVAVPTTAGTGSEVTRNAVLEAPEHKLKVSLRSHLMLPEIALLDPTLTHSVPPNVTASTGFDALSQVIEPFVSNRANPFTDGLCREALPRAGRSLRRVYEQGDDASAREDMVVVSLIGGLALANSKLGAVHGFAGPIGGMFKSPHGATCAALLPHVMSANLRALREREPDSAIVARYDEVARLLTGHAAARADDGIAWVREQAHALGIAGLGTWGVHAADADDVVAKARASSSMQGNAIRLSDEELRGILLEAL